LSLFTVVFYYLKEEQKAFEEISEMLFFSGAGERVLLAVVLKSKNNTSISMD